MKKLLALLGIANLDELLKVDGMTDEVKLHIFNPFFTTKPVGKGTGLGLNIVYDIIKNIHKGEIEITSTYGVGTEIAMKLPVKDQSD